MYLIIIAFVLLRLPSLFEGLWYADEGFYGVGADSILDGGKYYIDAWDHKPPMMVWIYMIGGIFDWGLGYPLIKALSILAGIFSIYLLHLLLKEFNIKEKWHKVGLVASVLLLGTTYLDGNIANAEVFFIPINLAILYFSLKKSYPYVIGFLFFASFLIKPQAFLEAAAIIFLVLVFHHLKKKIDLGFVVKATIAWLFSLMLFIIYEISIGSLYEFYDATVNSNLSYSGGGIYWKILFVIVSGIVLAILFTKTKAKKTKPETFLLSGIYLVNLFLVSLSGRAYQHYILQIIPIFILISGYTLTYSKKNILVNLALIAVGIILSFGYFYQSLTFLKPDFSGEYYVKYYTDFVRYALGDRDTSIWFWRGHSSYEKKEEFISYFNQEYTGVEYYYYGEDPWILSQLDANYTNKYLVWYHLTFSDQKMQEGITTRDNSFILLIDGRSPVFLEEFFADIDENFTLLDEVNDFKIYVNNEK